MFFFVADPPLINFGLTHPTRAKSCLVNGRVSEVRLEAIWWVDLRVNTSTSPGEKGPFPIKKTFFLFESQKGIVAVPPHIFTK